MCVGSRVSIRRALITPFAPVESNTIDDGFGTPFAPVESNTIDDGSVELGIARAEVDEEDLEVVAVWVSLIDLVHLGNNVLAELVVEYVFDLFRGARGTSVADEKGCGRGRHGC